MQSQSDEFNAMHHIRLIMLSGLQPVAYYRLLQYAYLGALRLPIGCDGTATRLRRMMATQG